MSAAKRPTNWCWASPASASRSPRAPMRRSARRRRPASGFPRIKVARKAGRIGGDMAEWMGRTLRGVIDWPALRRAGGSLTEPAIAVRTAREAVKVEKADGLVMLVGDVGRVQARAGTQAALDGLKIARGPADVARVAKLAEKKGSKTRAVLKMLGTGALFLSVASFHLAMWIFGAAAHRTGLCLLDQGCGRTMDAPASQAQAGAAAGRLSGLWNCARRLEPSALLVSICPGMPTFHHGPVEIAYLDEGEGEPIVLVHGFASNKEVNWVQPGWVQTLTARRAARDRARQPRPRRVSQALRSGRVSHQQDGRRRARADRASRHRARRRHGLFDGCAHRGFPCAGASGARCAPSSWAGSACS